MQQGGFPSPFDRNVATKMAAKTVNWLCEQLNTCAARDGRFIHNFFGTSFDFSWSVRLEFLSNLKLLPDLNVFLPMKSE